MSQFAHKDFVSVVKEYFDNVELDASKNNESFNKRLGAFCQSPTTYNLLNLTLSSTSIERDKREEILASTLSVANQELHKDVFLPLKEIEKSTKPAKHGEVIMWCDECYVVNNPVGYSCEATDLKGDLISNDFIFNFENTPHYVIGVRENMVNVKDYAIYETPEAFPDVMGDAIKGILKDKGVSEYLGETSQKRSRRPKI